MYCKICKREYAPEVVEGLRIDGSGCLLDDDDVEGHCSADCFYADHEIVEADALAELEFLGTIAPTG